MKMNSNFKYFATSRNVFDKISSKIITAEL